jgi:hypothetical protein
MTYFVDGHKDRKHDVRCLLVETRYLIFGTQHPVGLNDKNLLIKQALNKTLEFFESLEYFIFVFEQVNPSEFTKIINETNIIFISPNRITTRPSYIQEY